MEFFEKVIQAVEHFTEEVRILLEMLHGKAKDEAWNNQVKEKLSPAALRVSTIADEQSGTWTMEYRTYGNAFTRCPSDLCMWCKL